MFAVVDRREVGEVPLDAGRELVGLVVSDDAQARLSPGPLATAPGIGSHALSQPRPFGARDQHDSDREQGDVQPAHVASLPQRRGFRITDSDSMGTPSRRGA